MSLRGRLLLFGLSLIGALLGAAAGVFLHGAPMPIVAAAVALSVLVAFRLFGSFARSIRATMQVPRSVEEVGLVKPAEGEAPVGGQLSTPAHDVNAMAAALEARNAALAHRSAELESSLTQLRDAQDAHLLSTRLAAVGEMAGRTAHEVLNPVTGIRFRLNKVLSDLTTTMPANVATMGDIVQAWRDAYRAGGIAGLTGPLAAAAGADGQTTLLEEDLTNLVGIHSYLADLQRTAVLDLHFLLRETDRVARIADGMRSLTRASGTPVRASIGELLEESLETARDSAARRTIQLHLDVATDDQVMVDRYEFVQIVGNLMRNAFFAVEERHAHSGGAVWLSARRAGDLVEVRVRDDGCGIREEHVPFLFEATFTTRASGEGTGLGLGIARRLARGFQGELLLESTKVDEGTTFLLQIPIAASEEQPQSSEVPVAS